jgi:hypothetical protein
MGPGFSFASTAGPSPALPARVVVPRGSELRAPPRANVEHRADPDRMGTRGYRIILPDVSGHGQSSQSTGFACVDGGSSRPGDQG